MRVSGEKRRLFLALSSVWGKSFRLFCALFLKHLLKPGDSASWCRVQLITALPTDGMWGPRGHDHQTDPQGAWVVQSRPVPDPVLVSHLQNRGPRRSTVQGLNRGQQGWDSLEDLCFPGPCCPRSPKATLFSYPSCCDGPWPFRMVDLFR